MSSVLIAVAPKSLPEGLPGALVLLLLGMTVVFVVLGGLTLLIWFIGRVARERPVEAAATAAEVERGEPAATAACGGGTTEAKAAARDEPAGEPFTSAESAAVTVAVVLEASGRAVPAGGPFTSEELAGVAVAAAL
ncbi:MAG: hypothetical protein GYA57_08290, partial [Myxococcales bacterium]|nr:hypothetical protein [Myxococcales bacterium]